MGEQRAVLRRAAGAVAAATIVTTTTVVGSLAVPSGVAHAEEVFSEPVPVDADRVQQPRDVTSIEPARLADTRPGESTIDGGNSGGGPLGAGQVYEVRVTGRGGVPSDAAAVVLNVTAVRPAADGYLTVFPCGTDLPNASNVNYVAGVNVPNAVLAKVGAGGRVCVFSFAATMLVIDVNGYVAAGAATTPLDPARLVDTRANGETVDGAQRRDGPLGAGQVFEVDVAGRGGVPAGASAALLNVTAVRPSIRGYLTVFPCGSDLPNASNVNYDAGANVPNAVLAKIGDGGRVCVFSSADTSLVVDVNGFVAAGDTTIPIEPARLLDSRRGGETIDDRYEGIGRVGAGETVRFEVAGRGGVPESGVGAAMLNVTAVLPGALGYLTVYPCGSELPNASNVNFTAGVNVPNAVLARLGDGGDVCIFASADTELVVDANGWFALPPNQPDANVTILEPTEYEFVVEPPVTAASFNTERLQQTTPATAEIRTDTSNIEQGDTVVVVKPDGDPYYGRVEQRTDETIRTQEVALADVVPVVDVKLEADPETGKVTATEGAESVADGQVEAPKDAPEEKKPQQVDNTSRSCDANVDLTMNITADAQPGRFVFDMSFNKTFTGLNSARVGYYPGVEASLYIRAAGSVGCEIEKTVFQKQLPTIRFSIAAVPIVIKQELAVNLVGSVTASAFVENTFTAEASAFVGMVYEDGQWDRETSIDLGMSYESNPGLELELRLGVPEIVYTAKAYGIVGFEASVAANLRLVLAPFAETYLKMTASVDVGAAFLVELDLEIFKFRFFYEFVNATIYGPKVFFSLRKATTKCDSIATSIPERQCDALVALFDNNNGSNWTVTPPPGSTTGWGTNSDPCGWPGVVCEGGNVVSLTLVDQGLDGELASEIGDLTGLRTLDLSRNQLQAVPSELGGLSALRELRLSRNAITSVPSALGQLSGLLELRLDNNQLTSIPQSVLYGLTSLEDLSVGSNQLGTIPSSIGFLDGLRSLTLSQNGLTALPDELFDLTTLEFLEVDYNPIETMSPRIRRLRNLTGLFWYGTEIESVPSGIGDLSKLTFLKLGDNRLTGLPDSLGTLPNLDQLYVDYNEFVSAPAALSQVSGLTNLYAQGNPWNTDFTSTAKQIELNNPDLAAFRIGGNGCPRITDAGLVAWVEQFDLSWDAGC